MSGISIQLASMQLHSHTYGWRTDCVTVEIMQDISIYLRCVAKLLIKHFMSEIAMQLASK